MSQSHAKSLWKHWQIVPIALLLLAGLLAPKAASHAASSQNNWVQQGFNRQRTGYNPFETTISPSNVSQLGPAWSGYISADEPVENAGIVYVGDGYTNNMDAINASTGAIIWTSAGRGAYGAVAIANNTVYSATPSGTIYALNATNGALVWATTIGNGFYASPLWANGVIYLGSQNGRFYAFNAFTGKVLWSYLVGSNVSDAATDAGNIYVDGGGILYALSSKGKLLWKVAASGEPVIANGLVYAGTTAFNETTGKRVWMYPSGASAVAAANGNVYFSDGTSLYAANGTTGKIIWQFTDPPTDVEELAVTSTPVVANGVVYAGGITYHEHATIMAWNAATGAFLWYDLDENAYNDGSSPIVADGMLFYGATDDMFWAYHL